MVITGKESAGRGEGKPKINRPEIRSGRVESDFRAERLNGRWKAAIHEVAIYVVPAQAETHKYQSRLEPRMRGDDNTEQLASCETRRLITIYPFLRANSFMKSTRASTAASGVGL